MIDKIFLISRPFSSPIIRILPCSRVVSSSCTNGIHSRPWYETTVTVHSLFAVSWLSVLPFQGHLPILTLKTQRTLSQETATSTIQSLPEISSLSGLPFQEAILSINLPTWRALSPRRPEQWSCRVSSPVSLTNVHPMSRTLLIQRIMSLETLPATVPSPIVQCHCWMACHFKTISQV